MPEPARKTPTAAPRRATACEGRARTSRSEVTRNVLLDTAERLFALQGYDATGVRQIADEAGANLGAIHYYWRTKDMLCRDALERRLLPILAQRSAGLDAAEAGVPGIPGLRVLLDASHGPSLLAGGSSDQEAAAFRRFYGRMLFDPSPEVQAILASLLDAYAVRFVGLLRRTCGHLEDNEFFWRVTFMYGAFLYAHAQNTRTTALWGGRFDRTDFATASRYLTRFLEGGLRAPPAIEPWAAGGESAPEAVRAAPRRRAPRAKSSRT